MRLKKLGAALVVVAALGAVLASSAFAAAVTTDVKWYTGASPGTELTKKAPVTSVITEEGTFTTTVSGQAVELHSTGIECIECNIANEEGHAMGHGKLKFTGVTVAKPPNCTTTASITTKELVITPDYMIGTVDYVLFEPAAGPETGFASFELSGVGCPLSTTIIPKGTVFVKAANTTGTQAVEQEVSSSAAINAEAGGTLHVGTEAAALKGAAKFHLTGEFEGVAFGTH